MSRKPVRRRRSSSLGQRAAAALGRAAVTWGQFTFGTDTDRVGPFAFALLNWLLLLASVTAALLGAPVTVWGTALLLGLVVTGVRTAWLVPNRATTTESIYRQTQRIAGHPNGTPQRPAPVGERIRVTRWRGRRPVTVKVILSPGCPALGTASGQFDYEQTISDALPLGSGGWVHTWDASTVTSTAVPEGDVRLAQSAETRWVFRTLVQCFPPKRNTGAPMRLVVDEWREDTEQPVMAIGRLLLDTYDVSDPSLRLAVEDAMDNGVRRPGLVWLYDWTSTPGALVIASIPEDDPLAVRKYRERKYTALVTHHARPPRGSRPPTVQITEWVENADHPGFNLPKGILIDFGTMDVASVEWREGFSNALDMALEQELPDRVWLYDWTFTATSQVVMSAVPATHAMAMRKAATRSVRDIVAQKFPTKRGGRPTDVDILEWRSERDEDGSIIAEYPDRMIVHFGTADVTALDTRLGFQVHLDSTTEANDWHYDWNAQQGRVEVTAVPALPTAIAFPRPGTEEFDHWITEARRGRVIVGPRQGGGHLVFDFNKVPHALVGGNTGAGKSVLITLVLFAALYLPDEYELVVCDPKRTDFTWTPEFPNVRFAATPQEIAAAVEYAYQEMNRRQDLLNAHQVRNIGMLPPEDRPRRLIVFFDEMGAYFSPSKNSEIEELRGQSLSNMEQIAMLARAMWVNIVGAAQKPTNEDVGTKLRAQLGNKVAVGWLDTYTSQQVLGSTLASTLDKDKSPKGRGISALEGEEPSIFQTYYLPDRKSPLPWDPAGEPWPGTIDIVHEHLAELGYQRVMVPTEVADGKGKGGRVTRDEPQWVRLGQDAVDALAQADAGLSDVDDAPPADEPARKDDTPRCDVKRCRLPASGQCGECDRTLCTVHLRRHPMPQVEGWLCEEHYGAHHLVRGGGVDTYEAMHGQAEAHGLALDAKATGDASWRAVLRTPDGKRVVDVRAEDGHVEAQSGFGSEQGAMVPVFVVHAVTQWAKSSASAVGSEPAASAAAPDPEADSQASDTKDPGADSSRPRRATRPTAPARPRPSVRGR